MNMTHEAQLNDCEYYAERTDINGPAMTWGMFAINYLDLQNFTSAARYFNMSFQDNLHAPLQVWTETPGGNAVNFITGAGGFLQTVIMGYPGLRLALGGIEMSPLCPEGVTHLKIRQFQYLGNSLNFEFWCSSEEALYPYKVALTLTASAPGAQTLQFAELSSESVVTVEQGVPVTFAPETRAAGSKQATFLLSS
jgi:trehalose/maltose hydrolase-like predicted phosphorylase